jgi:hypothetical protein
VKSILFRLSICVLCATLAGAAQAEETSFWRVKVPDAKGDQHKAVLTFSDRDKAIEVHPQKADNVTIAYAAIDKCSYEYTKKHRISEGTVALAATTGVGALVMLTRGKSHWLQIDYHLNDKPKVFFVRMDKHEYIRILDALKKHAGIDAEVLGNVDKRARP